MKLLLLTCLLICAFNVEVQSNDICTDNDTQGYYWRDYTGDIPSDALPGGFDSANHTMTYVGQALFPNRGILIPGEINPVRKTMYFEFYGAEHTAIQDVKILCTRHPEHFEWIKTNVRDSLSSVVGENMSLITGGHEESHLITIGRVRDGENVRIAKVAVVGDLFGGLYFAANGIRLSPSSYQVLVYNPKCEETGDKKEV